VRRIPIRRFVSNGGSALSFAAMLSKESVVPASQIIFSGVLIEHLSLLFSHYAPKYN
jgi:hypothetical protein